MLWYKGWLETRIRLLMSFIWIAWFLIAEYLRGTGGPAGLAALSSGAMFIAAAIPMLFAGAGIATQPAFQATKGLYGSTQYTLSMPVSRLHLLAVRAGIGWLEMTAATAMFCSAMWLVLPVVRGAATAMQMVEYTVVLVACSSSLYFFAVLLASFLDEMWRMKGGMIAFGALWALSSLTPLPASVDIFHAMGDGSPLVAHTMPWTTIAFSLGLSAVLFFAALRVVQAREY